MKIYLSGTEIDADVVDPDELSLLLQEAGWINRGGRQGLYARWVSPEHTTTGVVPSVIVPFNREMSDYDELLSETLSALDKVAGEGSRIIRGALTRLVQAPGDELKFRRNVSTIRGAVPWPLGEELFTAARGVLVAGAKTRMSRKAYYGQINGGFAKRFLESVLMGQTEIGSYVVTAFTPTNQVFLEKEPRPGVNVLSPIGSYTGREILHSIVTSLEATREALDHFRSTSSLSGFEERVPAGVSREMTESLFRMTTNSDSADVTVELSPSQTLLQRDQIGVRQAFEFSGRDAEILQKASVKLTSVAPAEYVTATGWLSVVARPKRGEPGVVRMKVVAGSEASTLQVRLTEDQFEIAAAAIASDHGVTVSGRQEKDGNRYWLYDARDLQLTELPSRSRRTTHVPGQGELDL